MDVDVVESFKDVDGVKKVCIITPCFLSGRFDSVSNTKQRGPVLLANALIAPIVL